MQDGVLLRKFIIADTSIEIFVPDTSLVQTNYTTGSGNFISPYWAKVWPAATGLCYFLSSNLHYIQNKKVHELAAGLGLPGIFSAKYANQVCISDIEEAAIELVGQSVSHNNLTNVECDIIDLNDFKDIAVPEVVLLSDINYEPAQFENLLNAVHHFLNNQCTIILSTPQRLIGRKFINSLLAFCKEQAVVEVDYKGGIIDVSIFVFKN